MSSEKAPQSPFRLTCWKPAVSSLQWSMNSWKSALRITILHAWNLYIFKCWFIFHTTNFLGAENVPTTGEMWATRLVWPPLPSSGNTVRSRHPRLLLQGADSPVKRDSEENYIKMNYQQREHHLCIYEARHLTSSGTGPSPALPRAHGSGWPLPAKRHTEHAEALPAARWGLDTPRRPGLSVLPGWRTRILFRRGLARHLEIFQRRQKLK